MFVGGELEFEKMKGEGRVGFGRGEEGAGEEGERMTDEG